MCKVALLTIKHNSLRFNQCPPLEAADRENAFSSIGEYQKIGDFCIKKAVKTDIFLELFISILAFL